MGVRFNPVIALTLRVSPDAAERWRRVRRTQGISGTKAFESLVYQIDRSILHQLNDEERAVYMGGNMDRAAYEAVLDRTEPETASVSQVAWPTLDEGPPMTANTSAAPPPARTPTSAPNSFVEQADYLCRKA